MPLLNICAVTGDKQTIQIALVFLNGEKEEDYEWAMLMFRELIDAHTIQEPFSIVTDRELALIKCIDQRFP